MPVGVPLPESMSVSFSFFVTPRIGKTPSNSKRCGAGLCDLRGPERDVWVGFCTKEILASQFGILHPTSSLLLSQDLQEGFTWKGVTVTNPFAREKNDSLIALLADNAQS